MAISRKKNDAPKAEGNLDRLKRLAERWDAKKSKADDARSDLGNIAKEVEDFGFNKAAFKFVMKLRGMEPDKRNDYLSSINAYSDYFGIFAQGDLFPETTPSGIGPAPDHSENAAALSGKKAGLRGDRVVNPYQQDTAAHAAWMRGWDEGQAEAVAKNIKPLDPGSETHASA